MSQTPDRSGVGTSFEPVPTDPGNLARIAGEPPVVAAQGATITGFRCSQCGSEDIQKLSVVYETGTSIINTQTRGSSTGIGIARGGIGVGTAVNSSRTRGTQTSELAKRAAPPPAKMAFGWIVLGLVGGLLFAAFGAIPLAVFALGLCGFLFHLGNRYNGTELPPLRDAWAKSWLCHRCGTIFQIEPR